MASAWASSWGSSWGDSWGVVGAAAPVVAVAVSDDGGGGVRRRLKPPPDWRKVKQKELRRILEALGEELPAEVSAITAQHQRPATRTHVATLDIASLMRDMQAMQWLIASYQMLQERKRQDDEDAAFLLLL